MRTQFIGGAWATALLICLLCALRGLRGESPGTLDPELKKPYELVVVLHTSKHRQLTDVFRDRVMRELRDGLQAALGDLARVQVVQDHKRLPEVRDKGLQQALDGWRERDGVKTHFVLLDFLGDHYEIQARQHDGLTGLSSPVVRHDRTRDRDFVAKAAGLLVAQDFGLVGTVQLPADPGKVRVDLKGGGLVPLGRWVQKGEVFALVEVPAGPGPGRRVPYVLLQVRETPDKSGDGSCECQLFRTRSDALTAAPGIQGYRCLKLGTSRLPLRVRLVQASPQGTLSPVEQGLTVEVRRQGFTGEEGTLIRGSSEAGAFDTLGQGDRGLFEHAAFLTVDLGGDRQAKVPVPLVADQVEEVLVSVSGDVFDSQRFRVAGWVRNVADCSLVQNNLFQEIRDLSANPEQRAQALERARAGLQRTSDDMSRLGIEREELLRDISQQPPDKRPNLAGPEERLKKLQQGVKELEDFLAQLEKIDKEENDPKRKELLAEVKRADLLAKEAELGKAIEILEKVVGDMEAPELKQKLEVLQKAWEPRSMAHAAARRFIYDVWPGLDTKGVHERLEDARKAFAECKKVGDPIGPKKLLNVTIIHGGRLETELGKLNEANEDEANQIKLIKEINAALEKLAKDVNAYLQAGVGGK